MNHAFKKPFFWISGLIVSLGIAFFILQNKTGPSAPKLTPESLNTARNIWRNAPLSNYQMRIEISGNQNSNYVISVSEGKVVSLTDNGKPVAERIYHYWDVEGLFQFLDEELSQWKNNPDAYLSATFDETYHYPNYFLRQLFGNDKSTIQWKVLDFKPQSNSDL